MYHSKSATPVDDEKDFEKGRIRLEDDRVDLGRDGDVDDDDDYHDRKGFKSQERSALLIDFRLCHFGLWLLSHILVLKTLIDPL